jgi:4-hydroxy-2-oxoglutarate aldolase
MLLEGLQLPLTTPFYPDGRLNLLKLEHNVARYSKTPIAGIVVLSDFGEPTMLSDEETQRALRSVSDAAAVEKVLIAGVSRDSVVGTLDLAESAAKYGYDALLVKRPSLHQGNSTDTHAKVLPTYFQAIADRSALPVVLYSPGSERDGSLPMDIVIELATHPRIIGLVDGSCNWQRMENLIARSAGIKDEVTVTSVFAPVTRRMQAQNESAVGDLIGVNTLAGGGAALAAGSSKTAAKTRTKIVGFQILTAGTSGMLEGLRAGAVGAMPPFAASAPQACYEVLAAWKDGDEGLAEEKQSRLQIVAERIEKELGVAGIKFGCDLNGYFGGRGRLPLLPLTGTERAEIESLMQGLRN